MALPKGYWIKKGGRKFSKSHIENLKKSHLGQIHSPETRAKIREKMKGDKTHLYKDGRSLKPGYRGLQAKNNTARRKLTLGFHSKAEWELLKAQYNWTCPRCGRPESAKKLSKDHIIPISKGGSNNIENIQPLCRPCNSWKYTKIIHFSMLSVKSRKSISR